MKPFPIKIIPHRPWKHKFIEWELHNVCTYDCYFCGTKDGSRRWRTIEEYKIYVDKIIKACDGAPFFIQFTGGEPTLFPKLIELLQYIRSKNGYTGLISNGTRSMRWWKELYEANVLDKLSVSFHSEQTSDYQKIVDILLLFHNSPAQTFCMITHGLGTIDLAFEAFTAVKTQTSTPSIVKSMTLNNDVSLKLAESYTEDQRKKFLNNTWTRGILPLTVQKNSIAFDQFMQVTYNTGDIRYQDPQELLKGGLNNFRGWECSIGKESMRIIDNKIFRGICGMGGETYNLDIDPEIHFREDPIICNHLSCTCGADMVFPKHKKEDK